MKNILQCLRDKLKQQKENSANRINQMEGCTTITLDGFEQHRTSTSVGDWNAKRKKMNLKHDINRK